MAVEIYTLRMIRISGTGGGVSGLGFPIRVELKDVKVGGLTLAEAQSIRVYQYGSNIEVAREIVNKDVMFFREVQDSSFYHERYIIELDTSRSDYSEAGTYGSRAVWDKFIFVMHPESYTKNSATGDAITPTSITDNGSSIGFGGASKLYMPKPSSFPASITDTSMITILQPTSDGGKVIEMGSSLLLEAPDANSEINFVIADSTSGTSSPLFGSKALFKLIGVRSSSAIFIDKFAPATYAPPTIPISTGDVTVGNGYYGEIKEIWISKESLSIYFFRKMVNTMITKDAYVITGGVGYTRVKAFDTSFQKYELKVRGSASWDSAAFRTSPQIKIFSGSWYNL